MVGGHQKAIVPQAVSSPSSSFSKGHQKPPQQNYHINGEMHHRTVLQSSDEYTDDELQADDNQSVAVDQHQQTQVQRTARGQSQYYRRLHQGVSSGHHQNLHQGHHHQAQSQRNRLASHGTISSSNQQTVSGDQRGWVKGEIASESITWFRIKGNR